MPAFRRDDGSVTFVERGRLSASFFLACGQCIGCRLKRSREWAIRCVHEASLNDVNCFLTLTYDEEHVPEGRSLQYSDFQSFMKRLRARFPRVRIRFYMCGEYGEEFDRPHYHALLFGFDFLDKVVLSRSSSGLTYYRSPTLESLWPFGFSSIGAVTFESAAYVARYCMKKVTGSLSDRHYEVVDVETGLISSRTAEFNKMSLKPGIGASWLSRFRSDVYPAGKVIRPGGASFNSPRYYDKLFERFNAAEGDIEDELLKFRRYLVGLENAADQTDARLAVREKVAAAKLRTLKRSIS